jgi:hypothetical protein
LNEPRRVPACRGLFLRRLAGAFTYQLGPLAAVWACDREVNAVRLNGRFRPLYALAGPFSVFVLNHVRYIAAHFARYPREEFHRCCPKMKD